MPVDNERSEKVVAAFKETLSPEVISAVGEEKFGELTTIVREALQQERAEVAAQFEALAKALRSSVERPDLAL